MICIMLLKCDMSLQTSKIIQRINYANYTNYDSIRKTMNHTTNTQGVFISQYDKKLITLKNYFNLSK